MGEIEKLKLIIGVIAIILGLMILLFELLWWRTYQTGFVIVGAVSVFVMVGGFFLIWRQYRNKSGDYKDIVANSGVQKNIIDTVKPAEVKVKNLWVGISLTVIGFVFVLGGIIGYYIEKPICPSAQYPCFFHAGGGMGFIAVIFPASIFILLGIIYIYQYKKRIRFSGSYCCILWFLFIGIFALLMLLVFLITSLA